MVLVAAGRTADVAGPGALSPAARRACTGGCSRCTSSARCGRTPRPRPAPVWASKDGDPRVTPIGGILAPHAARRAAAALERAQGRHELRRSAAGAAGVRGGPDASRFRFYGQRHVVRPGLTGWAQVCYTYGATVEDALEKLQYDLYYIKNLSIALDLFIIFETIKTVVLRRGVRSLAAAADGIDQRHDASTWRTTSTSARSTASCRASDGTRWRAASCANTERLLELFDEFGVRARSSCSAGWPSAIRRWCGRSPRAGTNSRRTATRIGWSTTRRRTRSATTCAARRRCSRTRPVQPVRGYRAPSYSVTRRSLWALDVLVEEGYRYDASIFPIRHDRYGIPDAPRQPHRRRSRPAAASIEVPGSTVRVGGTNLPVAGGGYFRILPYAWTRWGIAPAEPHERQPAIFYLHPVGDRPGAAAAAGQRAGAFPALPQPSQDRSRACGR